MSILITGANGAVGKDLVQMLSNKYNIFGVSILDYLDLYRKFNYTNQESYRLDYIAEVELGVGKS